MAGLGGERHRAGASVLDRLLDAYPDRVQDRPITVSETIANLHKSVHRDVEQLLNARRPWRTAPWANLRQSPLGYGISDFTAGAFNDEDEREKLRLEIEETVRRFEPRLAQIQVSLAEDVAPLQPVLMLHISALLMIDPVPEPISFDTWVDTTTADVMMRPLGEL